MHSAFRGKILTTIVKKGRFYNSFLFRVIFKMYFLKEEHLEENNFFGGLVLFITCLGCYCLFVCF